MQTIRRGVLNTVVFTLTERVTIAPLPRFLMILKSRRTNDEKAFVMPPNLSSSTGRYDKFGITEGTIVTLTCGDWYYKIYEQASGTNTNVHLTGGLLEEGILRVLDAAENTYVTTDTNDTYIS